MQLKKKSAIISSIRHQVNLKKNLLVKKNKIVKSLIKCIKLDQGRSSSTGAITVRHKGNGCKKKLHILNSNDSFFGLSLCHMYSCTQNAFISLNFDLNNKSFFKTISTNNVFSGSIIISSNNLKEFSTGYRTQLKSFPVGSIIHSISEKQKIKYANSAGSFCQLLEKKNYCKLRLPSGNVIKISENAFGTLGVVSNFKYNLTCIGKAGRNRLKGIRPSVRGVAMNPVDHPHGGRTNGGRPSVTPWGIPTKGKPTVKK